MANGLSFLPTTRIIAIAILPITSNREEAAIRPVLPATTERGQRQVNLAMRKRVAGAAMRTTGRSQSDNAKEAPMILGWTLEMPADSRQQSDNLDEETDCAAECKEVTCPSVPNRKS